MQMPIDFGDWCSSEEQENNAAWYRLPSWMGDEHQHPVDSFYFPGSSLNCYPVAMRLGKDVALSGTATWPRCHPDGPVTAGMLKTFALYRYKGNLRITPK